MSCIYFGTDGIRGPYGGPVVNEVFAGRLGAAAGRWLGKRVAPGAAVVPIPIGRDTRQSGVAIGRALAAGLASEGWKTSSLDVLPTPAIACGVRSSGGPLGVVVTASHNPSADNGIKFLGEGGRKLSEAEELEIERLLQAAPTGPPASAAPENPDGAVLAAYLEAMSRLLPPGSLKGWRLVLDAANGATCGTSAPVLRDLGAEVVAIGDAPNGRNINDGCGSEHPALLATRVRAERARLGIAHDGDGDRCILCDERGEVLDGDEILTILAAHALSLGTLAAKTLVVTVHSNGGVDAAVAAAGGRVVRSAVGDRQVAERMAEEGATLGGESSGHVIFSDYSPVGDGLLTALKVIEVMQATGRPLSELRHALKKFPQASSAVVVHEKKPLETLPRLAAAIRSVEKTLGPAGRILVRYSGTEPKLRLLVEGADEQTVRSGLNTVEAAARAELGG